MPMCAQAVQSTAIARVVPSAQQARDALAHQVVGGAVVGLAGVAESARDRAEHRHGAELGAAQRPKHVEPALSLDVEHEVVFALRLLGQVVADLDARAMQQYVDHSLLANLGEHRRDLIGVGQVDLVPHGGPAAALNRGDRLLGRPRPLDTSQLALDQLRRRPLTGGLEPVGQIAREPVVVGGEAIEIGIARIRRRCEVEQVERATAGVCRQVGRDRRDDAAGGAGDDKRRVGAQRTLGPGDRVALHQADRPAQAVGVTDVDGARVKQCLLEQQVGEGGRLAAGLEVDDLHERLLALARQRLAEAADGSAHHRLRATLVIAVATAHPRRSDQEGAGGTLAGEHAHRGREQLHTHMQPVPPLGRFELRQRTLVIERRQPVDTRDRVLGSPSRDGLLELIHGPTRGRASAR